MWPPNQCLSGLETGLNIFTERNFETDVFRKQEFKVSTGDNLVVCENEACGNMLVVVVNMAAGVQG